DVVRIDSIYNPVRRANFTVAETRVGQRTDYDRLTLTVETNGTITPEDAVAYAAALAQEHFRFFVDFGKLPMVAAQPAGNGGAATDRLREVLNRSIDDVGLSVRSVNSLKNSNIRTLGHLVQYREDDLLKVKNVGEKALGEIAELLRGDEQARGEGERRIKDRAVTRRLVKDLGPRFDAAPGGHAGVSKLGHRSREGAEVARIEREGEGAAGGETARARGGPWVALFVR